MTQCESALVPLFDVATCAGNTCHGRYSSAVVRVEVRKALGSLESKSSFNIELCSIDVTAAESVGW